MLPQFMIYNIQEPFNMKIERVGFHKSHWHDNAFEFILVLQGSIHAALSSEKYILRENDMLIVSAEDVHSFSKIEEDNIVLFFQINCEYFQNVFPNIMQWILFANPISQGSENDYYKTLRYYLAKLFYSLPDSDNPLKELIPFLAYCERNLQSTHMIEKKDDITEKQMELFYEIDEYVYTHFTEQIDLSSISESLNYNKYYFSNLIKTITGMNFLEYLNHVRVLAAERFLISTDKNISEIAYDCGFSDIRSLNRYFKKWYSCTPNEYKKINSNLSSHQEKSESYTLKDAVVKKKLDTYIAKLEKTKYIDMKESENIINWEMPVLHYLDKSIEVTTEQKQWMLQETLKECDFDSVRFNQNGYNDVKFQPVPQVINDCIDGKIKDIYLFGQNGLFMDVGIKKPEYFVFFLLSKISRELIYREDGFIVGGNDSNLQILLYNTSQHVVDHYFAYKIVLENIGNDYKVKKYYLDEANGNAYDHIKKIGNHNQMSAEDIELIKKITYPKVVFDEIKNHTSMTFIENLPFQSAILICLEKI